jgi:hypothetical protein
MAARTHQAPREQAAQAGGQVRRCGEVLRRCRGRRPRQRLRGHAGVYEALEFFDRQHTLGDVGGFQPMHLAHAVQLLQRLDELAARQ